MSPLNMGLCAGDSTYTLIEGFAYWRYHLACFFSNGRVEVPKICSAYARKILLSVTFKDAEKANALQSVYPVGRAGDGVCETDDPDILLALSESGIRKRAWQKQQQQLKANVNLKKRQQQSIHKSENDATPRQMLPLTELLSPLCQFYVC